MLQAKLFVCAGVFGYFKRCCLGYGKDLQFVHRNFDITCGDLGVFGGTLSYHAGSAENEFASYTESFIKDLFFGVFVKSQLNDTASVTQVDKDKRTKVSLSLTPAHYAGTLAYVLYSKLTAIVSSF